MKILILCTGNSCRSQMAEGFLKALDSTLVIFSAGTKPAKRVHSNAIKVMKELHVDISKNKPKSIEQFIDESFDYIITVCGGAKETCPASIGKMKNNIHIGFDDPDELKGTDKEILTEFRRIRNEILVDFFSFYQKIKNNN